MREKEKKEKAGGGTECRHREPAFASGSRKKPGYRKKSRIRLRSSGGGGAPTGAPVSCSTGGGVRFFDTNRAAIAALSLEGAAHDRR